VSTHIEDLIRDAQRGMAERAIHPDRVRAALPARAARVARRRRYGALGGVATAAAVVLAVAVPAIALRGGSPVVAMPPAAPSSASAGRLPAIEPVPLVYRPTWLPAGLTERIRRAPLGSAASEEYAGPARLWTAQSVGTDGDGGANGLQLHVRGALNAEDPPANDGVPVDVGGQPGFYHPSPHDQKSYLEWRIDAGTVAMLDEHRLSLSRDDMLRVARSVRPDPGTLRVPLHIGWLPSGMTPRYAELSGDSPAAYYCMVSAEESLPAGPTGATGKEGKQGPRQLSVAIAPTTTAPEGGEALTVDGYPARLVARTEFRQLFLVVDLGTRGLLTVVANWPDPRPLTRDDLVRIAENVTVEDSADVAWIGTR
jgi:hypothetical protein